MKIALIIGAIVIAFIIIGFVVGAIKSEEKGGCTERGCLCEASEKIPCNTCYSTDYIFATGILNVVEECTYSEIIICRNGTQIMDQVEYSDYDCSTKWSSFFSSTSSLEQPIDSGNL